LRTAWMHGLHCDLLLHEQAVEGESRGMNRGASRVF